MGVKDLVGLGNSLVKENLALKTYKAPKAINNYQTFWKSHCPILYSTCELFLMINWPPGTLISLLHWWCGVLVIRCQLIPLFLSPFVHLVFWCSVTSGELALQVPNPFVCLVVWGPSCFGSMISCSHHPIAQCEKTNEEMDIQNVPY